MNAARTIKLTDAERKTLQRWSQGRTVATRQAQRAQIILLAEAGNSNQDIAEELRIKPHTAFAECQLCSRASACANFCPVRNPFARNDRPPGIVPRVKYRQRPDAPQKRQPSRVVVTLARSAR